MDEKLFFELDFLDIDDYVILEFQKFMKLVFDVELIINVVGELKYVG